MVIFQYSLYIFGIHLWTVLYPIPCYSKLCYKEVVVYIVGTVDNLSSQTAQLLTILVQKCEHTHFIMVPVIHRYHNKMLIFICFDSDVSKKLLDEWQTV